MEAVAAGDEVRFHLVLLFLMYESNEWPLALEVRESHVFTLEEQGSASLQSRLDQILDQLVLPIDGDRAPARQLRKIDAVSPTVERDMHTLMAHTLTLEPIADPGSDHQVNSRLLQHTGADALDDVLARAVLDDDRLDTRAVQKVSERQPRRAGTDDCDLSAHSANVEQHRKPCRSSTTLG